MQSRTTASATFVLIISVFLLTGLSSNLVKAGSYSTTGEGDNLSLTANETTGRVTGLEIDGLSVTFCSGSNTGGFYLRDNTTGANGLPAGVINELGCGGFGSDIRSARLVSSIPGSMNLSEEAPR